MTQTNGDQAHATLGIRQLADRCGVSQQTLRAWESRYGFPEPGRGAGGHRRYREDDVELVRAAMRSRAAGLSMPAAIERARSGAREVGDSLFGWLRRHHPELPPELLPKPTLIALSHAMEDELLARAQRPLLIGCFQQERFYRHAEARWRELARHARLTVALGEFRAASAGPGEPAEVPLLPSHALAREWGLICCGETMSACMIGWEPPGQASLPDRERRFEVIFCFAPELVREVALVACRLIGESDRALARRAERAVGPEPAPSSPELGIAAALTARAMRYVSN